MRTARLAIVVACLAAIGTMGCLAFGRASPPRPVFTRVPDLRAESRTAVFAYRVALHRPRFRCSLDGSRWRRCGSRSRVVGLADGRHRFCVKARAGNRRSRPACYVWSVGRANAQILAFTMRAAASAPLLPGGDPVPVDIAFANPNAAPIAITDAVVEVAGAEPGACAAAIRVVSGLTAHPVIAAAATQSLSQLGVPQAEWPHLAMLDDGVDQSACAGAAITLALTGSATG